MAISIPRPIDEDVRTRRRTHKKSRRGCANCKLRRVKCDELLPHCKKCKAFSLECSYDASPTNGMRVAGESSFSFDEPSPEMPAPVSSAMVLMDFFNDSAASDVGLMASKMYFNYEDMGLLATFRERTVLSVGTSTAQEIYQKAIFQLACENPFLTHIVLTLTLLHDNHLKGIVAMDRTTASHYHQGTAMFQKILSKPIQSRSKDALWTSAALLGAIAFAAIDAKTPQEAWPLKSGEPGDLDWLKMSDGKKAVFKVADPTRPDSIFTKYSIDTSWMYRPLPHSNRRLTGLARDYFELFNLGPCSSGVNNPYHDAAMAQVRMLGLECPNENLIEFMSLLGHINPELKALLLRKDPRAMLLIAWWFAKMYKYQWWIARRGLLEGTAICLYLERYHGHDMRLQRLLEWPRQQFGLPSPSNGRACRESPSASISTVLYVV